MAHYAKIGLNNEVIDMVAIYKMYDSWWDREGRNWV